MRVISSLSSVLIVARSSIRCHFFIPRTLGTDPEEETTSSTDNGGGSNEDLEGVTGSGQGGTGTVGAESNPVGYNFPHRRMELVGHVYQAIGKVLFGCPWMGFPLSEARIQKRSGSRAGFFGGRSVCFRTKKMVESRGCPEFGRGSSERCGGGIPCPDFSNLGF